MRQTSNAHTHTTWCDGENTPAEVARQAALLGFTDLGFSSHGPAPFDQTCPGVLDEAAYRADVAAVKAEYAGRLGILCGIEADFYSPVAPAGYDYVIGSQHYLPVGGPHWRAVDNSPEQLRDTVDRFYAGDAMAMVRDYYSELVKGVRRDAPTIVGHFDLVTKFNRDGAFFDEAGAAYQNCALEALDAVLDAIGGTGGLLEVNTGAISRGWRKLPYPAPFLLRHAAQRGARVIITSDSHQADTLDFGFETALGQVRAAGFAAMTVLEDGRFIEKPLAGK